MRWTLFVGTRRLVVGEPSGLGRGLAPQAPALVSHELAASWLRQALAHVESRDTLRRVAAAVSPFRHQVHEWDDATVLRVVEEALAAGRLQLSSPERLSASVPMVRRAAAEPAVARRAHEPEEPSVAERPSPQSVALLIAAAEGAPFCALCEQDQDGASRADRPPP